MIFGLATVSMPPQMFRSEPPLWVAAVAPATTVTEMDWLAERVEFDSSTATYRLLPIPYVETDDVFLSPIRRAVPVTVRAKVRGWVKRLSAEEDDDV